MSKRSRLEVRIGDDDEANADDDDRSIDDRRRKQGREDASNGNAFIEIEISCGWVKRWVKTDRRPTCETAADALEGKRLTRDDVPRDGWGFCFTRARVGWVSWTRRTDG